MICKQTNFNPCFFVLLTFIILFQSFVNSQPIIQYISTNIQRQVQAFGSIMGGTTLYIVGSGFSVFSNENSIFIGPYPCISKADGARQNMLVCQTTSATDPKVHNDLATTVIVSTVQSIQKVHCTSLACIFSYERPSTPFLYEINPRSAYGDQQIKIWGVHRITDAGDGRSATIGQVKSILINSTICSLIDVVQEDSITRHQRDKIQCNIYKDQDAGQYDFEEKVDPGIMKNSIRTYQTSLFTEKNYTQRIVAAVDSILYNSGGSFGQNIRLIGTGFASNISSFTCTVAGQQCHVTNSQVTSITVHIPSYDLANIDFGALPKDLSDTQTQQDKYLGSNGFRYTKYGITNIWISIQDWIKYLQGSNNQTVIDNKLVTQISSTQENDGNYAQYWRGYFYAPYPGVYRFAGIANDAFIVQISQVQNNSNLANLQTLIKQTRYSNNHFFPYETPQITTEANKTLDQGYYYLEAVSINIEGVGFFKMMVDIPQNGNTINPTWQVDKISISQSNMLSEIIQITVNNTAFIKASQNKFNIYYQTISSGIVSTYICEFNLGDTADDFSIKLTNSNMTEIWYYNAIITLDTVMEANSSIIADYIYTITIQNYRSNPIVPLSTVAGVKIQKTQNHSNPISGTYKLQIGSDFLSVWNPTLNIIDSNIAFDVHHFFLADALNQYYGAQEISVIPLKDISNINGITYFIEYVGVMGTPGPITLDTTLLKCASDDSFTATSSTIRHFSRRSLYNPIPLQFLRTAESLPQLYLTTNKIPIICSDCSYTYNASKNALVSSASLSTNTYIISVTDAGSVGFELSDISVYLLGVQCKALTGNISSFICVFDSNTGGNAALPAGSARPQIHIAQIGYADVTSITPVSVSMTLSSTSPLTPFVSGSNGGIQTTLTGTGFPLDQTASFSITLCDNPVTNYVSVSNQKIVFIVPKAVIACSGSTTSKISFSGQELSLTFNYDNSATPQITALSTHSASPILKGQITISGTQFTIQANSKVYLVRDGVKKYQLGITSFSTTSIQCVLGGGKTGVYNVQIFDSSIGASAINANTEFRYEIIVNSIYPISGGLGGGYDIIITGKNFASTDSHTVFIGDAMNSICQVKSATSTSIVCTVPRMDTSYLVNTLLEVVVTGRILQQSLCQGTCKFSFDPSWTFTNYILIPNILSYDAGSTMTIQGDTSKGTDLTGAIVTVGGKYVSLTTISTTSLSFIYPALVAGSYQVLIKTSLGYNYPALQTSTKAWQISTLYATSGSTQGHIITATCNGLASSKEDKNLHVYSICADSTKQLQIVDAAPNKIVFQNQQMDGNNSICKFNVTYGTFFNLYDYSYDFSKTPAVSITENAGVYTAVKTNLTNMNFDTVTFEYEDYNGNPTASVYSAIVTQINQNTSTIAPVGGYLPNGKFRIRIHSNTFGYAVVTPSIFVKSWLFIPTAASVTSSFVGGTSLVLSGTGFITSKPENNEISVCGIKASIQSATNSQLILTIPPLVTLKTQILYNLAKPSIIKGSLISDTPANAPFVIDGIINSVYSSPNAQCYIGLDFGSNSFANISSIKYMPNPIWPIAANMLLGAVFEGSNDSITWTTIFKIDTSKVHSGWNYWVSSTLVQYRFVRFSHTSLSGCQLSDLVFEGIIYSTASVINGVNKQCNIVIKAPITDITIFNAVTYSHSSTSIITAISPSFGTSAGGDTITIIGTNFGSSIVVTIDEVDCPIISHNSTQIKCVSDYRASAPSNGNSFKVISDGNSVLLTVNPFLYIDRWSSQATWGGQALPRQGDSVYVPVGMTLLVDVPSTPILDTIIVQGKIKFSDEMDTTLDAHYFIINKGQFEAGRQDSRYQHKLTITLHGGYFYKQLPIFGNKVLGCKNCKFSLHGQERTPTWTLTAATINVGDTNLTTIEPVDWRVGQKIVIAATSFDHYQSEQKTISAVSADKKTITVIEPFKFKHFSAVETHAGKDFVMRAEIGLLTRNIKIQGNDQSITERYGSHMMMSGKRDQGLVASFSYAQFTNCGQPKLIGRYCTHFHMAGQMPESSVRGIAVHHSFARVLTIHGTHFLTVQKNLGYHVQGHNIFIQDGIETNNVIQDNLLISSITSLTLSQSDITVASIWVTNPYNTIRRNHAAGGDFYGIWYEVKDHPDGPSATNDVCPMGMPLGISQDNVAHSNLRFGLRIFKLRSSKYPCNPISDESLIDPYTANQPILSVFDNYTLWKNKQCGFLGEELGYTTINNFKTIDSIKGGMQFHKTNFTKQFVIAQNSVIVGFSNGNGPVNLDKQYNNARGLIASRTDGLKAINISFVNFGSTMTPLQSCSECHHFSVWVVGSKTTYFEDISYVNITGNYIFWQKWRREVFMDLDGSLLKPLVDKISPSISSQTSGSITPYRPSVMIPNHCYHISGPTWNQSVYCDSKITLRSILFTNAMPAIDFFAIDIKAHLLTDPYDDFSSLSLTDADFSQQYMINIQPRSSDIQASWAMPFAVNHTYNIHWKQGIDFNHVAIAPSRFWNQTEGVVLRFNYTDNRQLFQIGKWYKSHINLPYIQKSNTLISPTTCKNGDYFHDLENKYLFVCVSGRNKTIREWIDINGVRCLNFCPVAPLQPGKQTFQRFWSNTSQWNLTDSNNNPRLPKLNENITIPYEWNLVLDINPPVLNYVQVKGDLIFDRSRDNKFEAHYIWVSQGNITIGSAQSPFLNKAQIILHGQKDDNYLFIDQHASGNKILVNTGGLKFFGNPPKNVWTKLTQTAIIGSTSINVLDDITGWKVGDQIIIAPSYDGQKQFEEVQITAISGKTISFTPALTFEHYGAGDVTISNNYGVLDARAAVGLLTRNIRITNAPDAIGWGCRVLNYGYLELPQDLINGKVRLRNGYLQWNGVQLDGCGQRDTTLAGLRIDRVGYNSPELLSLQVKAAYNGYPTSQVNSSSIHSCYGICVWIADSKNVSLNNNVFFWARKFLVYVQNVDQYIFTNNLMIGARKRDELISILAKTKITDDVAGYQQYIPIDFVNGQVVVSNNLVQGSEGEGFVFPFTSCDLLDTYNFYDNTAGSSLVGFAFNLYKGQLTCIGAAKFVAYACLIGLMTNPNGIQQRIIYQDAFFADNQRGITLRYAHQYDDNTIVLRNSYFTGISRPTCTSCYSINKLSYCDGSFAVRLLTVTFRGLSFPLGRSMIKQFDAIGYAGAFDFKSYFNNVTFENYVYSNTIIPYCKKMSVFRRHQEAADGVGSVYLTNSPCINCQNKAWAYFNQPNVEFRGWFGGCGQFDCTGPNNYLIYDQDGSFTGSPSQILANNSIFGDHESACTFISQINGHHCATQDLAVLQYESIAPDFNLRIMWPVFLFYDGGNWSSKTNGWRQWQWDNLQPLNRRMARFWSVIKLHKTYNLTYSGQPPSDSIFQIQKRLDPSGNPNDWTIIRIHYPLPNSIQVLVKNSTGKDIVVKPFPIKEYVPVNLTQYRDFCGANNFHYLNGTIQFVVNGVQNCQVRVRLTSYIQLSARINIPIADFYTNNGVTTFITNLCAFLGIDTGRLKIVGVKSGSTVITAVVQAEAVPIDNSKNTSTSPASLLIQLENLSSVAVNGIQSGSVNVGGPVQSVSTSVVVINPDGSIYTNQQESSSKTFIIILAVMIPIIVILITVGTVWYLKRKGGRVSSSSQSFSQVSFRQKQSKEFKKESIKVSQVPFQITLTNENELQN